MLNRAFTNAAKAAGCGVAIELRAFDVLLGKYPVEVCRAIAPKAKSAEDMRTANDVARRLTAASQGGAALDPALLQQLVDDMTFSPVDREAATRRVDSHITDCTGRELFIDASAIHPTCKSHRDKALAHAYSVAAAEQAAADGTDPALTVTSDPLLTAQQAKVDHYMPLMNLVRLQSLNRLRRSDPPFLGTLTSHSGEFAPHTFLAIAWLTRAFKLSLRGTGPRRDGLSIPQLTRIFRRRLKDEIISAIAFGFGCMLLSAGGLNPRGARGNLQW